MALLIAGLALFLGVHLVPVAQGPRAALAQRLGDRRYKGLFSLLAAIGLVVLVLGYRAAPVEPRVFAPVAAAHAAAPWLVTLAFILFAASHMRGHIRRAVQHPMVVGVI